MADPKKTESKSDLHRSAYPTGHFIRDLVLIFGGCAVLLFVANLFKWNGWHTPSYVFYWVGGAIFYLVIQNLLGGILSGVAELVTQTKKINDRLEEV